MRVVSHLVTNGQAQKEQAAGEDEIQKLTDNNIKDIDKITADKEKEIMDVK
jgi:ribosome recycling factor